MKRTRSRLIIKSTAIRLKTTWRYLTGKDCYLKDQQKHSKVKWQIKGVDLRVTATVSDRVNASWYLFAIKILKMRHHDYKSSFHFQLTKQPLATIKSQTMMRSRKTTVISRYFQVELGHLMILIIVLALLSRWVVSILRARSNYWALTIDQSLRNVSILSRKHQ